MKRPFRIWDSQAGVWMRGRNYKILRNAHNGALLVVRWSKVGVTVEVLDVSRGNRMMGQYTRKAQTIAFLKG